MPFASAAEQVLELDRLGYRYRFTVYPFEDHIAWVFQDKFDDPISHMGTGLRQATRGTSRSRGIRSWCGPIWALGHIGCGGCRS